MHATDIPFFQKVAIIHACVFIKSDSYSQFGVDADLVGVESFKVGVA